MLDLRSYLKYGKQAKGTWDKRKAALVLVASLLALPWAPGGRSGALAPTKGNKRSGWQRDLPTLVRGVPFHRLPAVSHQPHRIAL